jgi:hypothetical protein
LTNSEDLRDNQALMDTQGHEPLKMGCPVCGYRADWRWYPEFTALKCPSALISTPLGWMMWEYICRECHTWAARLGVIWDSTTAKVGFGFTGWQVSPLTGRIIGKVVAHTMKAPRP